MLNNPNGEKEQDVADLAEDDFFVDDDVSSDDEESVSESDLDDEEENIEEEDVEEDEEEIEEDAEDDSDYAEEGEEEQEVAEPAKAKKEDKSKQDSEENAKYAAARREAEQQVLILKQQQNELAKNYGYDSFEELQQATKAQKFVDEGYDDETAKRLVKAEENEARIRKLEQQTRIASEKTLLTKRTFFKELETEVDGILALNPELPVEMVFDIVRGRRFDELMAKKTSEAKQKALNNTKGKAHMKKDGNGSGNPPKTVSDSEYNMYKRLAGDKALSKKDYEKWNDNDNL